MARYNRITAIDVRDYLMDRSVEDNALSLDLAFSDEEISQAMLRAAREYNSIPPLIGTVDPNNLPGDTNMFLDGSVYHLLLAKVNKLARNDIDYDAGNVSTNIVAKQLAHMKELAALHGERFRQAARDVKISINIHAGFAQIG